MKSCEFWVMRKANRPLPVSRFSSSYPGSHLPSVCIVELTQDDLVYIWPSHPQFDSLCLVCRNFEQRSAKVCAPISNGYPCRFHAVPEVVMPQDFDDYIVDGDYLLECGYFYSFEDFKKVNGFHNDHFEFTFLGRFPSIRAARMAAK